MVDNQLPAFLENAEQILEFFPSELPQQTESLDLASKMATETKKFVLFHWRGVMYGRYFHVTDTIHTPDLCTL